MTRTATIDRTTGETEIQLELKLDGTPAFILGDALIMGSVPQSDLENALRNER